MRIEKVAFALYFGVQTPLDGQRLKPRAKSTQADLLTLRSRFHETECLSDIRMFRHEGIGQNAQAS